MGAPSMLNLVQESGVYELQAITEGQRSNSQATQLRRAYQFPMREDIYDGRDHGSDSFSR